MTKAKLSNKTKAKKAALLKKGPAEPSEFQKKCYKLLTKIPRGKVTTYREIARALGSQGYRAVGTALGKNQNAPAIPCHRVVCSDGSLGGYNGGLPKKVKLLASEGVQVAGSKIKNFKQCLFKF